MQHHRFGTRPALLLLLACAGVLAAATARAATLPHDVDSYVLLAKDRLVIGANGVVTGNVGVYDYPGKFARMGDHAQIGGGVLASSQAKLEVFSSVDALFANTHEQQAGAQIPGGVQPFGTSDLLILTPLLPFTSTAGSSSIDVPANTIVNVSPGTYRRIRVRKQGSLILAPGQYETDELQLQDDGSLRAAGPVAIRVRRKIDLGARTFVGPLAGSGISSRDIVIVTGARAVKIGIDGVVLATIYAPNTSFRTRDLFTLVGQVVAARIQFHPGSTIDPNPDCGNGAVDPDESCDGYADAACPGLCQRDCTCGIVVTPTPIQITPTPTPSATPTPSSSPTSSPTPPPTPSPTPTSSPSPTPTAGPTPGVTATPTATATPVVTATPTTTATPVVTPTPVHTPTPTQTPEGPPSPTPTTGAPTCGDGVVDRPMEECDDGNLLNGDGCSTTCNLESGEYCTYTMGGWGTDCHGNNPGCVLEDGFGSAFPTGLRIGDLAGPDGAANGWTALWTSSAAVQAFLPAGSTSGSLTGDLTDASTTPAGNIGGQLVSVKLALGILGLPGDLHLLGCVVPALRDLTVDQLVALADDAVATGNLPAGVSITDLGAALDAVNKNFDNCIANESCLGED